MIEVLRDNLAMIGGFLVGAVGYVTRIEVGQSGNRQAIKHIKEERARDRSEVQEAFREMRSDFKEMQSDIKTLLQRTAE